MSGKWSPVIYIIYIYSGTDVAGGKKDKIVLDLMAGTHQADGRPSASVFQASLFGVFLTSALVGGSLPRFNMRQGHWRK